MRRKKIVVLRLSLLVIILTCFSVQQSVSAQSSWKFKKAVLKYVDLSDGAEITAQPVKTDIIKLKKIKSSDSTIITIDLNSIVHSNLSGIGGAFNEQGGEAFMTLPEEDRKVLSEALFNPTMGSGFSFCRTAVGASDFGLDAYSYSETAEDYEMKYFSVERDEKSVIPFILAATKENPAMQIFASPWSPPGWMKELGTMDGGEENPSANVLKSDPNIYKAYGLYFSKYVQEYAKRGVRINRLIVQNETDMNPKYPGCDMLPEQMSELISDYIAPQFYQDGIKTEIWAGSFRGKRSDAQNFMKLKDAKDADGVGLQYCGPNVMKELRAKYPDLKMMHTEGRCENGNNTMKQARNRFGEVAFWINGGSENFCYWNIALNEESKSGWDWKQNSLIKIDRKAGEIIYNPDFAPIALLSRYIRPGDKSLKVETPKGSHAIAISNNDRLVVFVQNNEKTAQAKTLMMEGEVYSANIPAESLCALIFEK
jgi:glucosylceramidase